MGIAEARTKRRDSQLLALAVDGLCMSYGGEEAGASGSVGYWSQVGVSHFFRMLRWGRGGGQSQGFPGCG